MTQTYTITVRPVLTERQRELLAAERDADVCGDRRDSQGLDYAEERIAEAEADLAAHGEQPADDRPITSPPPWTREMGIAMLHRCNGRALRLSISRSGDETNPAADMLADMLARGVDVSVVDCLTSHGPGLSLRFEVVKDEQSERTDG